MSNRAKWNAIALLAAGLALPWLVKSALGRSQAAPQGEYDVASAMAVEAGDELEARIRR